MPPRKPPTIFQIPVKIHKITVLLSLAPSDNVAKLKENVLSAISQFQKSDSQFEANELEKIPEISSTSDFELCKAVRNGKKLTGEYTTLGDDETLKSVIHNWENVIMRIKNAQGEILPVRVAFPPLVVDDDDEMAEPEIPPLNDDPNLKRKVPPE